MFGGLHGSPLAGAAGEEGVKEDDVAQQIVEKGALRCKSLTHNQLALQVGTHTKCSRPPSGMRRQGPSG